MALNQRREMTGGQRLPGHGVDIALWRAADIANSTILRLT